MSLPGTLSQFWLTIQGTLFPWLERELGELSGKQKQLVSVLELLQVERYLLSVNASTGRPREDRGALARSYVGKAVYNLGTTRQMVERLGSDATLRRLCGWERASQIPSEATFSRAFAEFSRSQLPWRVHEAVIAKHVSQRLVGHISRDATEIMGRERALKKAGKVKAPKPRPQPRRKKGEGRNQSGKRLERQQTMTLQEMLADLPTACDCGSKRNSKGYPQHWLGYKLHLDVADGQIPISCILTSASVHDSQVALPLATLTAQRVTNLYDLMDSAYDAQIIKAWSRTLGHVPLIESHRRSNGQKQEFAPHEAQRFRERTAVERVYARLKEEFGGRMVRVRGPAKVMTSLMFGIIALTADQLLRLVS